MPEKRRFVGFGLLVFTYLVLGLAVSNALLYYLADYSLGTSYYESLVILNVARHTTLAFTVTVNVLVNLFVLALVFAASLYMTHRISGPMYRFEKTARALVGGDLTVNARVREKDFLRPQAEEFAQAIDGMRARLLEASSDAVDLKRKVEFFAGFLHAGRPDPDEARALIEEMKALSGGIKDGLDHFKTGQTRENKHA